MKIGKAVICVFGIGIISAMFLKPVYADEIDDLISKLSNKEEMEKEVTGGGFGAPPTQGEEIIMQLAETGDPKVIEPLIESGANSGYYTTTGLYFYMQSFSILGKIATEPLIQAMKNKDIKVRRFATKIVGFTAGTEIRGVLSAVDKRAIYPLLEALKDEDKIVRMNAAYSLGMLGRKDGLEIAINGLEDSDWRVVGTAIDALGWITDKKAMEALEKKLKEPIEKDTALNAVLQSLEEAATQGEKVDVRVEGIYVHIFDERLEGGSVKLEIERTNLNGILQFALLHVKEGIKFKQEMLQKHDDFVDE